MLTLTTPGATAAIASRGASLRALSVRGIELVQPAPEDAPPPLAAGTTLAPWPNRVRDARWTHDGVPLRLEPTETGRAHAIHGLVAATDFTVRHRSDDAVGFVARIAAPAGYPFQLDVGVDYRLADDGLEVAYEIVNTGSRSAPVALGAHPYLRVGPPDVRTLDLTTTATRTLLLGDDDLPRKTVPVDGTAFDLRDGSRVGAMPAHAAYTGHASVDGVVEHRLSGPDGTVVLWADARFDWLQVYLTDEFPTPRGPVAALAVEPMTAPPDALNSGVDLELVEPGDTWRLGWGLRLET